MTFDIDANGIVHVTAKDKATGKEQNIRIQASGGLSDADIDKMVKEAEINAEADKRKRAAVEARNHAESTIHQIEKTMEEIGSDVPADDKAAVEKAIADLKAVMDGDNADAIQAKTNDLQQAAMKIGELAYRKQQEAEAGSPDTEGAASSTKSSDDDVIDADFTNMQFEEDDKKGNDEKSA